MRLYVSLLVAAALAGNVFAAPTSLQAQDAPVAAPPSEEEEAIGAVESLLAVGGEAPVPNIGPGAPNYSPEQTAGVICNAIEQHRSRTALFNLQKVHQATVRAKKARRDFQVGRAGQGEVDATELERQTAVIGMAKPIELRHLPPSHGDGLVVEKLGLRRLIEHGRPVLIVSGVLRNFSMEAKETPPILFYAIDARGFAVASQTNAIDVARLEPSQSAPFSVRYRNPPAYTATIHATFAPPFLTRAFRGCGFFDPALYDVASLDVQTLNTEAKAVQRPPENGAPPYLATELAALARTTFADALDAYQEDQALKAGTDPYRCASMQSWRELLRLGDLIEEAWVATNAAEEVRRDAKRGVFLPEEVAEADQARVAAVKAFMGSRPENRTLDAAPLNLAFEKLAVETDSGNANFFAVVGDLRNNGDTPAVQPPVLVQVKDRYGHVISERHYRVALTIPPKRVARFQFNFDLPRSLGNALDVKLAC